MGSLIVRNLDDDLIRKLKQRAARNRRSAEAEHRDILQRALGGEPCDSFKDVAAKLRTMTAGRQHTPAEDLQRGGHDER